jgi:hypothetical protein
MKTFKQHIVEKLKIGKVNLLTPAELADRIYDSYEVTHINELTDAGIVDFNYSYFEYKEGNLLFAVEIMKEPEHATVYTVILPDEIYDSFETITSYDGDMELYRCPRELYEVVSKEFVNPPRVFFMRGVTDWKENTNYKFHFQLNNRQYIDTKNDIYIKLTNG